MTLFATTESAWGGCGGGGGLGDGRSGGGGGGGGGDLCSRRCPDRISAVTMTAVN
jgi:hypothetical protein